MLNRSIINSMVLVAALVGAGNWAGSANIFAACVDGDEVEISYGQPAASPAPDPEQRGEEVREEFHQSYPIAPDGRVSLENLNGNVRITVSDRNEVQVNAVKRAYRQERLNEAKIEISSTADAIRIKTTYPSEDQSFTSDEKRRYNNPALVEYSLVVPRNARIESVDLVNGSLDIEGVEGDVKASSVNGRVVVRGLKGETKLDSVNGNLEATFAEIVQSKPLSLGSVNGNVVVVVPSDSNAVVRAETINGAIENDFGLAVQHGEYVGHSLYGQIGSGGTRIKLSNVNGAIVIKRAQDGRSLSSSTSLLSQKDKDRDKDKNKTYSREEIQKMNEDAHVLADQVRREVDPEVQRETQRALRDAEREIQLAQREVQRETQRQVREQLRSESRGEGRGAAIGKGHGVGTGSHRFEERELKSFPVTSGARVNIMTFDGAITVHGWDKSEVQYDAVKRAGDEEEVKAIRIDTEQQGSSISIIANSEQHEGTANLDVFVPRNSSVHISSDDGALSLQGVTGELTLRTGDGNIEVTDSQGQLKVNTGDGRIRIAKFDGQVDARTGDGAILLDGKFTNVSARTGSGTVSLAVAADSNFTIESDAEEIDNQGLTLTEDVAPSKRAKRWKVGRGGNVFVLSAGDGKIVIRPR